MCCVLILRSRRESKLLKFQKEMKELGIRLVEKIEKIKEIFSERVE
jgi:hypothetical protein